MSEYRNYIRFDWAAKRILRDKANFVVLEGLLSVLLNDDIKIVELIESEGNVEKEDSKFNRVDIMAKNDKGELIMIEIQLSRQVHYLERILFGVGKTISDHIARGEKYDNVKKVYSISILYFDYGEGEDYIYKGQTEFRGLHTGDKFTLTNKEKEQLGMRGPEEVFPEYYLIRINEFNQIATTPLEEWISYLKDGKVRTDTTTPGLKEAKEKLNFMNMTTEEQRAYEHYLDSIRIEEDCLASAKIEGRAEGRKEGLAEGVEIGRAEGEDKKAREVALRLLSANMDPNFISDMTGLSIYEIQNLK